MKSMKISLLIVAAAVAVAAAGCNRTSITVLTQAPPGRTAALDVESRTLTISQGLAVALECTQYDDNTGYSGPCRDMNVALDDTSLADVLPVHLDALAGQNVTDAYSSNDNDTVTGPAVRQGVVLAAKSAGSTTLTVTTKGDDPLPLTFVVAAPPDLPDDE